MDPEHLLHLTADHVRERLGGEASGHDWWHAWRVWRMAGKLAEAEGADQTVVQLAALLHDVADWKLAGGDLDAAPRAARAWLEPQGAPPATVDHVCRIVGTLSFKGAGVPTPMETLEGMVVQDADRLDALGALGVARAFAYGGHRGRLLHDPDDAPRPHGSFEDYRASRGTTVNHFHEKLLLLADRMNTRAARRLARSRHRFMERYLAEFHAEWDGER